MLDNQRGHVAGAVSDGENARAALGTVLDVRDVESGAYKAFTDSFRVRNPPADTPQTVGTIVLVPSGAINHFD
jgi:hypothetical protein